MPTNRMVREEHFKRNSLAWAALHHFLPSRLLQELSGVLVDLVSGGTKTLDRLFEHQILGAGESTESWALKPRDADGQIAEYLQRRIEWLADATDREIFFEVKGSDRTGALAPSVLEDAIQLGLADISVLHRRKKDSFFPQSSMMSLFESLRLLTSSNEMPDELHLSLVNRVLGEIEKPLSAVVLKHFGDLNADADEWHKALFFYECSLQAMSEPVHHAWKGFVEICKSSAVQSCAAAIRTTKGAGAASLLLSSQLDTVGLSGNAHLHLNASNDAYVASYLASPDASFHDRRVTLQLAPMLLQSRNLELALTASEDTLSLDSQRLFWSALRRQIALGSANQSRRTKALFARSIFNQLQSSLLRDRNPDAFALAVRLSLESGQLRVAKQLQWSEEIVDAYLTVEVISAVVEQVAKFDGSKKERSRVAMELFGGWTVRLSDRQSHLAAYIQRQLIAAVIQSAEARGGSDAKRALELLGAIADAHPEFRDHVAADIAALVVKILRMKVNWTVLQSGMQLALLYTDSFGDETLASLATETVAFMAKVDPSKEMWPIVRPSLDFLSAPAVKRASLRASELEEQVSSTILRFGLNQETEHTRLLFHLQDLDVSTVLDDKLLQQLSVVVDDVRSNARRINASNAVDNIRALLVAPAIAGRDGVLDAIDALERIMRSALDGTSRVSFPYAYAALDMIAPLSVKIAAALSIEPIELQAWLQPVAETLPKVWGRAISDPLIFTQFSLPPSTTPDPTIIHNWAFASIGFAIWLDRLPAILETLEEAALLSPDLNAPIAMACATRLAATPWENLQPKAIRAEDANTFYATLGKRLVQIGKLSEEKRNDFIGALLDQCFRHGPNGLDLAVFLAAIEVGVTNLRVHQRYGNYVKRLENNRLLRAAIKPLVLELAASKADLLLGDVTT